MSSIAYVTDEKMLEYHRLCANREMVFWRLTANKKFTDFQKGDLLFFFARAKYPARRKGLVGYGHFEEAMKMSVTSLWKKYTSRTGYDSLEELEETMIKASRSHKLPRSVSCLYLTQVVFFTAPVLPSEVGIKIPARLESYQYLDKEDPSVTVRILKEAEKHGLDVWSFDGEESAESVFRRDEIRHEAALASRRIGPRRFSESERKRAAALINEKAGERGYQSVPGSPTELIKTEDGEVTIAMVFVSTGQDRQLRCQEYIGRRVLFTQFLKKAGVDEKIRFVPLFDEKDADVYETLGGEGRDD